MKQKHFMDIENLREEDTELRIGNFHGFEIGDVIQITSKIDGSNGSIRYDNETDTLVAFSRKRELNYSNTLNGFWNYVQSLDANLFKPISNYVIFGEWMVKNKVRYDPEFYSKWYVYDVYDVDKEEWLPQLAVKMLCGEFGFTYINELYYGPFQGWDHVRSFLTHRWHAINEEEGIIVKNMSKLNNPDSRQPFYLKIVNDSFKETKGIKEIDPSVEVAKSEAQQIVESIVTRNRVEKQLFKMRDEGILPDKIMPSNMKLVAQNIPKRIYDDCIKEEKELVVSAGEYFGKMCSSTAMKHARDIILGG